MHAASRHGLKVIRALTPVLLVAAFALTIAVMLPGLGVTVNGATRWLGAGPLQFQPSELLKLALVLYAAQLLAARPALDEDARRPGQAAAARGRRRLRAAAEAARHGHRDGHLLRHRRAAAGRRHPGPAAGRDLRDARRAGLPARRGRALPARAPDLVPRPLLGRRRHRLPGRAGAHGDRLGRLLRRRPRRVGAEDLLPARGAHGHDPGHHRRGARPDRASSARSASTR